MELKVKNEVETQCNLGGCIEFRVLMRDSEEELHIDETKKSPKRGGKRKSDKEASPKVSPDAE